MTKEHARAFETGYKMGLDVMSSENMRLRELVTSAMRTLTHPSCDDCVNEYSCKQNLLGECVEVTELRHLAQSVGIDVDEVVDREANGSLLVISVRNEVTGFCPRCPFPDLELVYDTGSGDNGKYSEQTYVLRCRHQKVCKLRHDNLEQQGGTA